MLTETARIVALDEHSLWVQTLRQGGCGKCAQGGACSCALLGGRRKPRVRPLQLPRSELPVTPGATPLRIGQEVGLGLEEGAFLGGVFLVYLAPLLGLLTGTLVAHALWGGELASVCGGLAGFAAGLAPAWYCNRRWHRSARLQPRVLRVLEAGRRESLPLVDSREIVP